MYYIADGRSFVSAYPEDRVVAEIEKLYLSAQGMTEFIPGQVKLFSDGASLVN